MSKTKVIEVFERTQMIMQIGTDTKDRVTTVAVSADDLKELNSDYINEHYGSLQDEAYQKGYDKGYADKTNNDEVGKELAKDVYQRGLEEGKEYREKGCEGCEWEDKEYNTCTICRNSYKNLYERKKADDEIKVGDVVDWDGDLFIVTYIAFDGLCGVAEDGATYDAVLPENVKKTGRHFDIGDMLKGINWT